MLVFETLTDQCSGPALAGTPQTLCPVACPSADTPSLLGRSQCAPPGLCFRYVFLQ